MSVVTVGPLSVAAPCAPSVTLDDIGFVIGCGGTVRNGGTHPLLVSAQSQPAGCGGGGGGAAVSAPVMTLQVQQLLAPKATMALPAPPQGQQWVVVYMTRKSLRDWAIAGGVVTLTLLGFAGVGVVDLFAAAARRLNGGRGRRS